MVDRADTGADDMAAEVCRALAGNPALTEDQRQDVERLCDEIREFQRAGETGRAIRAQHRAMAIIHQGAPAPE